MLTEPLPPHPCPAPQVTTRLQLSPLMLEQFGELKVNPPATLGDVPATLALLQQKMVRAQTYTLLYKVTCTDVHVCVSIHVPVGAQV